MKNSKRMTLLKLSQLAGLDPDDTLLILWEAGIEGISEPSDELVGAKLFMAKRVLSIPNARDLTSLSYWQSMLSADEKDLRGLLEDLDVPMSKRARTLPKGAIRKLRSFLSEKSHEMSLNGSAIQDASVVSSGQASETFIENVPKEQQAQRTEWRIVGHKREVRLLTLEEVLGIHYALVKDFCRQNDPIIPPGPMNEAIIGSAVFRQHTSIGSESKYPSVEMSAAALLHSLVHDHPFHNGNKRTALVSMLVLLDENNLMITCGEDDLFKFVLRLAQHRIVDGLADRSDREVLVISEWIKTNTRPIERGDRPIAFRKLRPILIKYGCRLEHSTAGSNIKITRTIAGGGLLKRPKVLTTNISYGGDGRDVLVPTLNKIRAELFLDEEHGIDSAAFYANLPFATDEFIVKYRKILHRLAKF